MSLIDNLVTRFPNGVTNSLVGSIFNSLKIPDMSIYQFIQDDFETFSAALWSVGGVGTPTRAQQAGLGGLIRLTGTGASGDSSWLQTTNPTFQIQASPNTKKIFYRARVTLDSASLGLLVAGLQIPVAANNFLTPVNGIFFRKAAGVSTVELVSRAASVETTTGPIFTLLDATPATLDFYFDGVDTIWAAVNGATLAKITPAALPSVLLGTTFGVQNGTAVARALDVDQVQILQER